MYLAASITEPRHIILQTAHFRTDNDFKAAHKF